MVTVIDAIRAINPTAEVSVSAEDVNQIVWENGTVPIPKADIETKLAELQTAYDAEQYARDREKEYPTWQDQMDMLWHSIDQDAALKSKYFAFHQAILAVKSKHPK